MSDHDKKNVQLDWNLVFPNTFVIYGDPIPLSRPRFGKHRVWDSQKHLKVNYHLSLQNQFEDRKMYTGPIHLDITFYLKIAASYRKKISKLGHSYHIFKPDLSNMIKFVEDCAQGILFYDDCIISSISARKIYDDNPRTEFTVKQL